MSRVLVSARKLRRRHGDGERGQALVEFAFVLPILLLLLLGIIQFGLLFYTCIDLTSATRDGARKVAVSRATGGVEDAARKTIRDSLTVVEYSATTVTVSPGSPWAAGVPVTVKVTYPYSLSILGVTFWSGPMTATSISRIG